MVLLLGVAVATSLEEFVSTPLDGGLNVILGKRWS